MLSLRIAVVPVLVALTALLAGPRARASECIGADGPQGDSAQTVHPAWSPDGTRILIGSDRNAVDRYAYKLYSVATDGSDLQTLTTVVDSPEADYYGAWSPDGSRIAFRRVAGGAARIHVMNADGTSQTALTPAGVGLSQHPAWSPDGTRIAFVGIVGGQFDLLTMRPDGSDLRVMTADPAIESHPAWSPDGSRIAVGADYDDPGNGDVYVVDVATGTRTRLTSAPGGDGQPAWSPDGTTIAFRSLRDGTGEIYAMAADGSQQTNLTQDFTKSNDRPSWSPDGARIVFSSTRDDELTDASIDHIYVMNADGTEQRRISDHSIVAAGTSLLLKSKPTDATRRKLVLAARDPAIVFQLNNHSTEDPTFLGGSLRLLAGSFDVTYPLPAQYWFSSTCDRGYKYKDRAGEAGPVAQVVVRPGKLKVVGKGAGLAHALDTSPEPVIAVLVTGTRRYCFLFGGDVTFRPGVLYKARRAAAIGGCPDGGPLWGS